MIRAIARSLPLLAATLAGSAAAQGTAPAAPGAPGHALPPPAPTPLPAARPEAPPRTPGGVPSEPANIAPSAAPAPPVAAEHVVLTESPPPASTVAASAPVASPPLQPPGFTPPAPADVPPPPPRPKGPVESRFNVGLNLDAVWYRRPSYDLFSKKDVAQNGGLSLGYAVLLNGPLSVVPEIGFGVDSQSTSGLYAGAIQSTALDTKRFYGGVSVRYALLSFLEPHARLVGGASIIDATIAPGVGDEAVGAASAPTLTDTKASPFASLGAGFTVRTPDAALETNRGALRSLVFGVTFEGGYVLAKSVDLTPSPEHPSGRILVVDAPLGTLERSGPYFRAPIVARF